MILEQAILPVIPGKETEFEAAFAEAKELIAASPGCRGVEIQRCVEQPNEYLLLVSWDSIEDHTEGFRNSEAFGKWREMLYHFYEPKPVVRHYELTDRESGVAK